MAWILVHTPSCPNGDNKEKAVKVLWLKVVEERSPWLLTCGHLRPGELDKAFVPNISSLKVANNLAQLPTKSWRLNIQILQVTLIRDINNRSLKQ